MTNPRYLLRRWRRLLSIRALIQTFGMRCFYCHVPLNRTPGSPRQLTIDHYVPRFHGGTDRRTNLRLACATCNRRKGVMDPSEFLMTPGLALRITSIELERWGS